MTTSHQSNAQTVATQTVNLKKLIDSNRLDCFSEFIDHIHFGQEAIKTGEGVRSFDFGDVDVDDALKKLDEQGYKSGSLGDLLVFASENFESKGERCVVALGSKASLFGHDVVPGIRRYGPSGSKALFFDHFKGIPADRNVHYLGVLK